MNRREEFANAARVAANALDCAWGSFQYDEVTAMYQFLCDREQAIGRDSLLEELGIAVGVIPFEGITLREFKHTQHEDLDEMEENGDDLSVLREELSSVVTVTDALHYLRDSSYDLWSAVPCIAAFVFPGTNLSYEEWDVHACTGFCCWLLKSYSFVENEEPFTEFDT